MSSIIFFIIRIDNLCEVYGLTICIVYTNISHIWKKKLPSDCRCHRNTHHDNDEGNAGNKSPRQCRYQTTMSQGKEELSQVRRRNWKWKEEVKKDNVEVNKKNWMAYMRFEWFRKKNSQGGTTIRQCRRQKKAQSNEIGRRGEGIWFEDI